MIMNHLCRKDDIIPCRQFEMNKSYLKYNTYGKIILFKIANVLLLIFWENWER